MIARLLAQIPPRLGGAVVAQMRDYFVLAIHQGHARAQVRGHEFAVSLRSKCSRVCLRKSPHVLAALSSPKCAITLFSRSIRVTRAPKSGITNSPCRIGRAAC